MNIAIFASAFYPHVGGVEELCRQLAHEYRRMGHGVLIVTNRWPRSLPEREEFESLKIFRMPQRVPEGNLRTKLNYYLTSAGIRRKTASILREHQVDLIHVQCVSANGLYAAAAAESLNVPLVVTLQGELTMDAGQIFQRSQFARNMLMSVLDRADVITGCSQKTLNDGEEFYGKPFDGRGRVVFNGARVEDFETGEPFQHGKPYIFALGRVVPQKGFDVLLRAFSQIVGDGGPAHGMDLLIAGEGSELARLKTLAAELGLGQKVHFVGRADRTRTVALFRGASLFVLPSRADEGLPVVCAEALAAGKAIVATRSGGAPEAVVDGECGIIVEKEDVEGLAAAMTRILSDEALCQKFQLKAKQRSTIFSWSTIARNYLDVYGDAMAKSGGGKANGKARGASAAIGHNGI